MTTAKSYSVPPIGFSAFAGVGSAKNAILQRAFQSIERQADALEQPVRVTEHTCPERLDRREHDRLGITEQAFVMFELVELVGELLDLLHLVVDHLNELGDLLRCVQDGLNVHGGIKHDPLGACRDADAERHERECDELLHGVPFVMLSLSAATRGQSRERIYHEAKKGRCISHTTCKEVRGMAGKQSETEGNNAE